MRTGSGALEHADFRRGSGKKALPQQPGHPDTACDGERVYAYFGSGLAALDKNGGCTLAQAPTPIFAGHIRYGAGSSVVLAATRSSFIGTANSWATAIIWTTMSSAKQIEGARP